MKVDLFYGELKYVKIEQQQAYDLAAFFSEYCQSGTLCPDICVNPVSPYVAHKCRNPCQRDK